MMSIRPKSWLFAMPAIIYLTLIYEPSPGTYPLIENSNGAVLGLIISIILLLGLLLVRANQSTDLPADKNIFLSKVEPEIPQKPLAVKDILFIAGAVILLVLFFVVVYN